MTAEVWAPIRGWQDYYEVSNEGHVRSKERTLVLRHPTGRMVPRTFKPCVLTACVGSHGYKAVVLSAPGKKRESRTVHTLVAEHFCPGKAPGLEVCHNDGDKMNCSSSNLRWDTRASNAKDVNTHGQRVRLTGESAPSSKLTVSQVRRIRAEVGRSARSLAREMGVSHKTVSAVRSGISWNEVF